MLELRTWSAKARTDGRIPKIALRTILSHDDPRSAVAILVDHGLAVADDDGWTIDWAPEQKTADQRERGLESGRQKAAHGRGDHSMCPDTWKCRSSTVTGDGHKSAVTSDGHSVRKGRKALTKEGRTTTPASPSGLAEGSSSVSPENRDDGGDSATNPNDESDEYFGFSENEWNALTDDEKQDVRENEDDYDYGYLNRENRALYKQLMDKDRRSDDEEKELAQLEQFKAPEPISYIF
ncbi:hypothetical protein [Rhodococcoides trifolii]|uniref:hypothetical protein n=1 Tax=Rhodococcoides trifolii TaxID=908250 RepID=UPI00166F04C4|nr:hypothetical protein [Rhodococcus trifolii]